MQSPLDRLGEPEEIAREAGAPDVRYDGPDRPRAGRLEWLALVLVLFGAGIVPLLTRFYLPWYSGWLLGVLLLWTSPVFTTGDKLMGAFVPPTGFLAARPSGCGRPCSWSR